jgi:hemolysin-activating ACP:hemolysin acyltransferase
MRNSTVVVDCLYLLNQSDFHKRYTLAQFNAFIVYPIIQEKIRIFYEEDKPVSLVTWCWFTDEEAKKFLDGRFVPKELNYARDWGDQLWGIEFIAPFGHARQTMRHMRNYITDLYGPKMKAHFRRLYYPEKEIVRRL